MLHNISIALSDPHWPDGATLLRRCLPLDLDVKGTEEGGGWNNSTPLLRLLSKLEVEREVQTWAANYAVNKVEVDDDGTDGRLTPVERVDECTIEQVLRSCPPLGQN
jgi:hypothetical protein